MTRSFDAYQEAAIAEICLEVFEETPLCFLGRGFRTPDDEGPYSTGFTGWPFASWVLLIWLEAGLVDLCFDSDLVPDAQLRALGWVERAEARDGYCILQLDDARVLLTDFSYWHATRQTGGFYPLRSDATDETEHAEWSRTVREATTPAPAFVQNPEMID